MGIVHVRGRPPEGGLEKDEEGNVLLTKSMVDSYISGFNERLATLLSTIPIDEKELEKLGRKDPEK